MKFVDSCKATGLYVNTVSAYRSEIGELRFGVVAWENPANLDSTFKLGMTSSEYEVELAKQKQAGLRPVSVTSYDNQGIKRYAASWVRYKAR